MGKKQSNDYRLWVAAADGTTFTEVKGQTTLKWSRDGGLFDSSSKDDGAYATQMPGLKSLQMSMDIFPNLPDVAGYGRLEAVALASPQVPNNVQIRKAGSAATGTDAVFAASVYIGNFGTSADKNSPVSCSFSFGLAAPPTVDLLA